MKNILEAGGASFETALKVSLLKQLFIFSCPLPLLLYSGSGRSLFFL